MEATQDALTLSWLVRLRWAALLGAALLVVVLRPALHVAVPVAPLVVLGGLVASSNLLAASLARRPPPKGGAPAPRTLLSGLLWLDGLLLTAALYLTGGAANPFAASYLLLAVLAAATLGRRAGILAVAAAVVAVAVLAVAHRPLQADHEHEEAAPEPHHDHPPPAIAAHDSGHGAQELGPIGPAPHVRDDARPHDHPHGHPVQPASGGEHLRLHARGTGAVFAVLAALVVYLVSWALRQRETQLEALEAAKARSERLADVGAFASSAAHELGTPLSTIAVAAKELERALEDAGDPVGGIAEAQAIRRQVDRCREILDELARVARGEGREPAVAIPLGELMSEARAASSAPDRVRYRLAEDAETRCVVAPRRALLQVLRSIIANALRAAPRSEVALTAETDAATARIAIEDDGEGMAPELLDLAGEQPMSSRQGLGVGLFVGRAILERLGGTMDIDSKPGQGTRVTLSLPLAEEVG